MLVRDSVFPSSEDLETIPEAAEIAPDMRRKGKLIPKVLPEETMKWLVHQLWKISGKIRYHSATPNVFKDREEWVQDEWYDEEADEMMRKETRWWGRRGDHEEGDEMMMK